MVIQVKGYLTFRELVGERRLEVEKGLTVRALLEQLEAQLGESFTVQVMDRRGSRQQHVPVLLNGRHCTHLPDGLDTELSDGDQVDLFPPLAGGSR
jgi:molybdopterin synthase sulfur carrier subunit